GFGRKPKDGDSHAFQGIHRRYVLVIVDEACGVMEELWTGVEAITTTANSRILAIGNPDDRETTFGDTFCDVRYEKLWNRISIPAHDSPNFTGEQVPDPLPDVLVQRSWVQDRLQAWGEEDPRYKSKVLAEFSEDGEMGLFNSPLLAQAFIDDDEKVAAKVIWSSVWMWPGLVMTPTLWLRVGGGCAGSRTPGGEWTRCLRLRS